MNTISPLTLEVGELLRSWRQRRRVSQLHLAVDAEISQRHLSFVESGRSRPSREMLLRLSESLDIPLRERNILLTAAGFAPLYGERDLHEPEFEVARKVVEQLLKGHEPYPALAVDRHWTLLAANDALSRLIEGLNPEMLKPPVNVLRLSLHPDGLASRIINFREWRNHVLSRLTVQIDITADSCLADLYEELKTYPVPAGAQPGNESSRRQFADIAIPLILDSPVGELSFLSTTTIFGTPIDISLSELAIESFFPMNEHTARAMRELALAVNSP